MKDFKNRLMRIIDNSASQAKSFVEGVNEFVESFDVDAQIDRFYEKKNELIKRGNELFGEFTELLKQVKDSFTDFSVTVPFDESIGEKLSYEVSDGNLNIEVSYADETQTRSNKTSVAIPSNCDLEQIRFTSNSTMKTATIMIPKKVAETPIEEEAAPTENLTEEEVREPAQEEAVEDTTTPQGDGDETLTHISSKLAQKLRTNGAKYAQTLIRNANGNFVRREPKSE